MLGLRAVALTYLALDSGGRDWVDQVTLVRRVLLQAAVESEMVLDEPAPVIRVSGAGGSYKYMIFVHFESYPRHYAGVDSLLMHVWVQCARHGIVPSAVTSEMILRRGVAEEIKEPSPDQLLADIELFSEFDKESRQRIVGGMRVHAVAIGDDIVRQGDDGDSLFVIAAGMVRVMLDTPTGTMEVAKLGAGQYFGEMSLLVGDPRGATVVAHTDCHILEIDKQAFQPVFDGNPEFMQSMARMITERELSNEALEQKLSKDDLASKVNALAANLLGRIKKFFS
ncbi:MAG: cyclic nucleotide-binding domain-containing protein [Rhodospirillales bacterium]|nr:cyclic nucleotide-binding domain-containing protein [Rhodospirillales bacterium]